MIQQKMTVEQYAWCAHQLQQQYGVDIVGWQGSGTVYGVTARSRYDGETLTVEILDKPFLMPRSLAEACIRSFLSKCG